MYNLYIDFDGVILNTIEVSYNELKNNNISLKDDEKCMEYYKNLNWKEFLKKCKPINHSIESIQNIIDTNKFNVNILSHVTSLDEAVAKIEYIRKYFKDITFIPVPKTISKTKMVHVENTILIDDYSGNLKDWEKNKGVGVRFNTELESNGFITIDRLDSIIYVIDSLKNIVENSYT